VMLCAPLLGITIALLPLQLLWLNLLTDGLLGLGLGVEPADRSVMQVPPRRRDAPFFNRAILRYILLIGLLVGFVALGIGYVYFEQAPTGRTWQTMIFTSIAFMQIGQALASRSQAVSFFELGLFSNPTLLLMAVTTFVLQLLAVYVPFFEDFFQVTPLSPTQLLICLGTGGLVFALIELQKWLTAQRQRA